MLPVVCLPSFWNYHISEMGSFLELESGFFFFHKNRISYCFIPKIGIYFRGTLQNNCLVKTVSGLANRILQTGMNRKAVHKR